MIIPLIRPLFLFNFPFSNDTNKNKIDDPINEINFIVLNDKEELYLIKTNIKENTNNKAINILKINTYLLINFFILFTYSYIY